MRKFYPFLDEPQLMFQSLYDSIMDTISVAMTSVRYVSMKNAAEQEVALSARKKKRLESWILVTEHLYFRQIVALLH